MPKLVRRRFIGCFFFLIKPPQIYIFAVSQIYRCVRPPHVTIFIIARKGIGRTFALFGGLLLLMMTKSVAIFGCTAILKQETGAWQAEETRRPGRRLAMILRREFDEIRTVGRGRGQKRIIYVSLPNLFLQLLLVPE